MSKGTTTSNDILKMVLNGTDPAWRGNASVYVALHTTHPGYTAQNTVEAAYTSYARVAVAKASGWTDGGATFSNTAAVEFPACTGGSETYRYLSVGTLSSGAGQILYVEALTAVLAVSVDIQPSFAIGALTITES